MLYEIYYNCIIVFVSYVIVDANHLVRMFR